MSSTSASEGRGLAHIVGEVDGFGRFGVLEVTDEGVLCHVCGGWFRHLGLHAYKAHGITAAAYRQAHGLARGRGLVTADLHQVMATKGAARMGTPAGERFVASRDPAAASAARIAGWSGFAPEVMAQLHDQKPGRRRPARVEVVVVCERCGAVFCPLFAVRRRRFCSRSCSATVTAANRVAAVRARAGR